MDNTIHKMKASASKALSQKTEFAGAADKKAMSSVRKNGKTSRTVAKVDTDFFANIETPYEDAPATDSSSQKVNIFGRSLRPIEMQSDVYKPKPYGKPPKEIEQGMDARTYFKTKFNPFELIPLGKKSPAPASKSNGTAAKTVPSSPKTARKSTPTPSSFRHATTKSSLTSSASRLTTPSMSYPVNSQTTKIKSQPRPPARPASPTKFGSIATPMPKSKWTSVVLDLDGRRRPPVTPNSEILKRRSGVAVNTTSINSRMPSQNNMRAASQTKTGIVSSATLSQKAKNATIPLKKSTVSRPPSMTASSKHTDTSMKPIAQPSVSKNKSMLQTTLKHPVGKRPPAAPGRLFALFKDSQGGVESSNKKRSASDILSDRTSVTRMNKRIKSDNVPTRQLTNSMRRDASSIRKTLPAKRDIPRPRSHVYDEPVANRIEVQKAIRELFPSRRRTTYDDYDSDSDMEATGLDILDEEERSAMIGRKEDLREEMLEKQRLKARARMAARR